MNPQMMGMGGDNGINLLSIIINVAFGFVIGLVLFFGFETVITYGQELAAKLISMSGYGQQMAMFGLATTAAPYIVLAPIAGMALRHLASIRTIKSFAFFAAAIVAGIAIAFFTQGYFATVL